MKPKHTAYVYNRRGRLLAVGHNQYDKTHVRMYRLGCTVGDPNKIYLHAEVAAIIKALRVGTPYRIVVERFFVSGAPAPSKPCAACSLAIKEAQIKQVEYT